MKVDVSHDALAVVAGCCYLALLSTTRSQKLEASTKLLAVVRRGFRFLRLDTLLESCVFGPPRRLRESDEEVSRSAKALRRLARSPADPRPTADGLPEDALASAFEYCAAADLLSAGVASPAFLGPALGAAAPWRALEAKLPAAARSRAVGDARQRFFERVLRAAVDVAADAVARDPARVVVAFEGSAYDVTGMAFASKLFGGHGREVLAHYAGRDATAAIASFAHSADARRLMRPFKVFDPVPLVGRPGIPLKALDRARGAATAKQRAGDKRRDVMLERLELRRTGVLCVPRRRRGDDDDDAPG